MGRTNLHHHMLLDNQCRNGYVDCQYRLSSTWKDWSSAGSTPDKGKDESESIQEQASGATHESRQQDTPHHSRARHYARKVVKASAVTKRKAKASFEETHSHGKLQRRLVVPSYNGMISYIQASSRHPLSDPQAGGWTSGAEVEKE